MHISTNRLPWLIGMIAVSLIYAACPVSGQGLLRRLEDRVRQRLEERALLPTPAENGAVLPDAAPPTADRPVLGVEVDEVPSSGRVSDVVVAVVHPNSAAAAAGLQPRDRIISFGGVPISSVEELSGVMQRSRRGDRLLMVVQRDGQRVDLAVRLQNGGNEDGTEDRPPRPSPPAPFAIPPGPSDASGRSPETGEAETIPPGPIAEPGRPETRGRLGLTVEDPRPARGKRLTRGALVVEMTPGGAGAEAGLKVGDTIVAFDGALIADAESLILQMRRTRPGQRIELQYIRDQKLGRAKVTLAGPDDLPAKRSGDPSSDEPPSLRETGARNAQSPRNEASETGLGALGSVLGGLFGGGNAGGKEDAAENTDSPVPDSSEVPPSPDRDLPPSLEAPEPENASSAEREDASPAELQETVRRLEATNRRLERRLQQLEERMEAIMQSAGDEE